MNISEAEARQISEGHLVVRDGQLVRADTGVRQGDGLTLHVQKDDTGREIRTWTGPKSAWMDRFKSPRFLQLAMSNSPEWSKRVADQRRAELAAAGVLL